MRELLAGSANGRSLKEQSQDRYVSYSSATNAIAEAKRRLRANNIAHAVVRAMGMGYLSFPTGSDQKVFPL